ncbi:hypothetical protein ACFQI3_15025 [Hansschlegelia quercus]|uniref:Antifreeze protein n=1 Tax=Hansschlegelia quercus TaxID=2528245 RepID=A0A4Q9GEM5_9HYPH|nr:hypothetical protein [Hansschlegelia quercus]TBN48343.1 hypothetical protein EYR15_14830 [Hansschlegelia quercus]
MKAQIGLFSTVAIVAAFAAASPASALTMKECGAKYQAAKKDGSLKDLKWADFRKAQCGGDEDAPADEAKAVDPDAGQPAAAAASKPAVKTGDAKSGAAAAGANVSTPASSAPVFPREVSAKYASETPGRARMHTCVDQYRANKAAGATGLRWIEKGGGYYAQCNARLKG